MNKMELKVSATVENEAFVRTAISAFSLSLNPTLDEISDLKTIISEAVSNAIIHGYNCDSSKDQITCRYLNCPFYMNNRKLDYDCIQYQNPSSLSSSNKCYCGK